MSLEEMYKEEQELYRKLDETIEVVKPCRQCGECCRGVIFITAFEAARIMQKGWKDFYDTDGLVILLKRRDRYCIFLEDGKCLVHDVKPFQCRAFPVAVHPIYRGKKVFECRNAVYRVNEKFSELITRRMAFLTKYYNLALEIGIEKMINASKHLQNTP